MRSTLGVEFLVGFSVLTCSILWGCSQATPPGDKGNDRAAATTEHATETDVAEESVDAEPRDDEPALEVADAGNVEAPALEVPTEPEGPTTIQAAAPPAPLPASEAPLPLDRLSLAELVMPQVVLSEQHAAISKTKVGDPFPNFELPDVSGGKRSLTELFGPKLTVVVFWDGRHATALEELSDLNRYYLPRFGDKGLAVVAVNSGDAATEAFELAKAAGASYPVLSDADGKALAQVATDKLPRSYLLDASGKVLWFDLEYSPTTRRDLAVAIRHTLGE